MLELLRTHDPLMKELPCGHGSVLVPPSLGGRIFCQMGGELIHRLDAAALRNPSPTEYDNLGGNSLWPAPEGGVFAFNYPPGGGEWMVQDGIAKAVPEVTISNGGSAKIEKRILLTNRKGVRLDLDYRRVVVTPDSVDSVEKYEVEWLCYETEEVFEPRGAYGADEVLLAPWSLEQFPGADGIVAFGKVANADDALNLDFYGDPGGRISWEDGCFAFRLGGADRHQIGIRVKSRPEYIGALDTERSLLLIRKTKPADGKYFNIADNDQAAGPFSAADLYSIFNGGALGFYELETIGAMQTSGGVLSACSLSSQTLILKGRREELLRYLSVQEGYPEAALA